MKKTTYVLALAAAAVLVLAAAATSLVLINGGLFASGTENRIESAAKQSNVFKTNLKGDDVTVSSKNGVSP